jgi:hypothetical protein
MKTEYIDTRAIDYGVGVLRGVLSRPELAHMDQRPIELSIAHMRGAARLIERLQRQLDKERRVSVVLGRRRGGSKMR